MGSFVEKYCRTKTLFSCGSNATSALRLMSVGSSSAAMSEPSYTIKSVQKSVRS
jgi:hypothetical protein